VHQRFGSVKLAINNYFAILIHPPCSDNIDYSWFKMTNPLIKLHLELNNREG